MTRDQLTAWLAERGLTHRQAASLLALSIRGFRSQLYGERPVSNQTSRIVDLIELVDYLGGPINQENVK